jgi:parallel beta-helix repeat protein
MEISNHYLTEDGRIRTITKQIPEFTVGKTQFYKEDAPIKYANTKVDNHPPIHIDGNEEFTSENGVIGGSGTEEDPYIIENWIIAGNGSVRDGIFINNTNAYFVIRNCTIYGFHHPDEYHHGIKFQYVKYGRIDNTTLYECHICIEVRYSTHITIGNCSCYDFSAQYYGTGIHCYHSSYINISSFEGFNLSGWGIDFWETSHSIIEKSKCYNNKYGIVIYGKQSVYNTIKDCKIFNNHIYGIDLWFDRFRSPSYAHILRCEIYENGVPPPGEPYGYPGLGFFRMSNNIVEDCIIHHNGRGIAIEDSPNNIIRNCSVFNHSVPSKVVAEGIIIIGGLHPLSFLSKSRNNKIINCDFYNNEMGIFLNTLFKAKIQKNNIFNNSDHGIHVNSFSTAQIHDNNIYSNGFNWEEWNPSIWIWHYCMIDARNNWWGAEDGPTVILFDRHSNEHTIRDGHGDTIYLDRSILFPRPWAIEPIPDAGANT